MDFKSLLLGLFIKNVKTFGIIVTILTLIICLCIYIFVKRLLKKADYLEELHDDILKVRMSEEGRRSFTDKFVEYVFKVDTHEKRIDRIEIRLDKKYDQKKEDEG